MSVHTVKPITPADIATGKRALIPSSVIEAFNAAIAARYAGGYAKVLQDTVVRALVAQGYSRSTVFDSGWLNVEEVYEDAGWKVKYEKSAYNEEGAAYFEFTRKTS